MQSSPNKEGMIRRRQTLHDNHIELKHKFFVIILRIQLDTVATMGLHSSIRSTTISLNRERGSSLIPPPVVEVLKLVPTSLIDGYIFD
jgi:hypothetical protein